MFLHQIRKRNPLLVRAAVELHQAGTIPPNTFLFDLDAARENATILIREALKNNLQSYLMTKHFNRNPFITAVALDRGFNGTVAVDIWGAKSTHRCGNRVGHIGHLNQIPKCEIESALRMGPEVITVFSLQAAEWISEAAQRQGKEQCILLRVFGDEDIFFTAQEGGIAERDLDDVVADLRKLPGIRIVGVTSFPCLNYNLSPEEEIKPTPNLYTILRAAERLRKRHGLEVTQINAPGNNFTGNYQLLHDLGATHVEPGQAVLGTTPSHAFFDHLPEKPCFVYVTEVSHLYHDEAYVYGGGFWVGAKMKGNMASALVGRDYDSCMSNELRSAVKEPVIIDYHGFLKSHGQCRIGDTAIYGFYSQIQMTRSYIAVASGISRGKAVVEGIFDHAGNLLDDHWCPVPVERVKERIRYLVDHYR